MTPSLPRATQIGSQQVVEHIWIWFSDNGNIRKWDSKPFPEGTEYVAALSRTAQAPVADGVVEDQPVAWQWRKRPWAGSGDGTTQWSKWQFGRVADAIKHEPADYEERLLYAAPKPSPTAPATGGVVEADELRRYIDRCRELSAQGEYAWWSRLADILAALSRSEPQAAPVSHGGAHDW